MEQHQAVKPNINIERKVMTGVVRLAIFLVVFPIISGLRLWLLQHPPDVQKNRTRI